MLWKQEFKCDMLEPCLCCCECCDFLSMFNALGVGRLLYKFEVSSSSLFVFVKYHSRCLFCNRMLVTSTNSHINCVYYSIKKMKFEYIVYYEEKRYQNLAFNLHSYLLYYFSLKCILTSFLINFPAISVSLHFQLDVDYDRCHDLTCPCCPALLSVLYPYI